MKGNLIPILGLAAIVVAAAALTIAWQANKGALAPTTKPVSPGQKETPTPAETAPEAQITLTVQSQAEGTVTAVSGNQITLDLSGESHTFTLDEEHPALKGSTAGEPDSESEIPPVSFLTAEEIKVGDQVTAFLNPEGQVQSIVVN